MGIKGNRKILSKLGLGILAMIMALGFSLFPGATVQLAYAGGVSANQLGAIPMAQQGESSVEIKISVTNNTLKDVNVYGIMDLTGLGTELNESSSLKSDMVLIGASGASNTLRFYVDVKRAADAKTQTIPIKIYDNGEKLVASCDADIRISEKGSATTKSDGNYLASMDADYSLSNPEGIVAGSKNEISVTIFNRGNCMVKNVDVSLDLPEGMSINNSVANQFVGYMMVGDKRTLKFPVTANTKMDSKNYALSVVITGKDSGDSDVNFKRTFYIPVLGTGSASLTDLNITNVNIPQQSVVGEDFSLNFDVVNNGKQSTDKLLISVEPAEGITNKTKSIFSESSIEKGGSKHYSITFFGLDSATEKSYPIKITVKPAKGSDESDTVIQYASIMLKKINGNTKTPQLMIDQYDFGGTYVQANSKFRLNLGLFNTSNKNLSNIKVTLNSADGIFVPVKSSNSFYIDGLEKKGHTTKSMMLSVKPGAEQKTTSLEVNMTYEDGAGNEFNSKDVISIPIIQETRLQVDELVPPAEIYAGQPVSASVQFYNLGKTVLNNLRVNATGDFDTNESISYFVGNMEGGKSDTYDFTIIPKKEGPLEGLITFTYEDVAGAQQTYSVPFVFQVMGEMPAMEDPGTAPEEQSKVKKYIPWIIGCAVISASAVGILIFRKIRKKKLHQEMEIDE